MPVDHNPSVDALTEGDIRVWKAVYWAEVERRIGSIFARTDARVQAMTYLAGLLSPAERKNSWQLAEISGAANPYAFQHLLGRAIWDADALRDRLFAYVPTYLDDGAAVGVLDETGFLKKGQHSVGVARQYSGTAGQVDNCQIGVFLAYASSRGQTLLDRDLYLPASWHADRRRCDQAGVPADRTFLTKPAIARLLLERANAAHVALAWVTGDSVYGDDSMLRCWLMDQHQASVLAITGKERLSVAGQLMELKAIIADLPATGWERLSAGAGSKGLRWYDWQQIALTTPVPAGWQQWLLLRRSRTDANAVSAYLVFAAATSTLMEHVRVVGMRWTVEESIQTGKGEVGLDQYEVRRWVGWYRHITLAMWAHALLSVIRSHTDPDDAAQKKTLCHGQPSSLARFKASRGLRSD